MSSSDSEQPANGEQEVKTNDADVIGQTMAMQGETGAASQGDHKGTQRNGWGIDLESTKSLEYSASVAWA